MLILGVWDQFDSRLDMPINYLYLNYSNTKALYICGCLSRNLIRITIYPLYMSQLNDHAQNKPNMETQRLHGQIYGSNYNHYNLTCLFFKRPLHK
jgi:hypothetical protein